MAVELPCKCSFLSRGGHRKSNISPLTLTPMLSLWWELSDYQDAVVNSFRSTLTGLARSTSSSVYFLLALLYFFPNTLLNPVSVNLYRTFPSFTLDTASLHPSSPS